MTISGQIIEYLLYPYQPGLDVPTNNISYSCCFSNSRLKTVVSDIIYLTMVFSLPDEIVAAAATAANDFKKDWMTFFEKSHPKLLQFVIYC